MNAWEERKERQNVADINGNKRQSGLDRAKVPLLEYKSKGLREYKNQGIRELRLVCLIAKTYTTQQ